MKTLLSTLLLTLHMAAMAQQEKSKHTFRILFFDAPAEAPKKLFLFDGTDSQEVELPKMNFSPVYELPAGPLYLRLLPGEPEDPKNIPPGAPSVQLPENVNDFYLLITSDKANSVAPVRMQVVSASHLAAGQMLWFNITDKTVGGTLGSEKLLIEPGKRTVINPPAAENGNYPVSLAFTIPNNKNLYPLCETYWRFDSNSRSVVFIRSVASRRAPRVEGYSDYRPSTLTADTTNLP